MTRVVLTAGFDRARHVLTLAELLRRSHVTVAGILVVTPYNWKRVRGLVRQRGLSFVRDAVPRLLGRTASAQGDSGSEDAMTALMAKHDVQPGSLKAWASQHDVFYRTVDSVNAPDAVAYVAETEPDWVVYGGGGILRNVFIDAAGGRILNAHSGPLPEIRGMNACEWSLLLGYAPSVTIHLINRGIDTGGLISNHPIEFGPGDTIDVLRSRCVAMGVEALHQTVLNPPSTLPKPLKSATKHRQCFVLAPAVKDLLERRLAQGEYAERYT